mmetsp:Transcript_11392/g.22577  ORF Transcript_11392/g.22577 Transcript_11392/m.22577 type:complete len:334 (-) Transcript_11392:1945-2946(-)
MKTKSRPQLSPTRKMSSAEISSFVASGTAIPRRKQLIKEKVIQKKKLEIKFSRKDNEVAATINLEDAENITKKKIPTNVPDCSSESRSETLDRSYSLLDSFCGSTVSTNPDGSPYVHTIQIEQKTVDAAQLVSLFRNYVTAYRCLHRVGVPESIQSGVTENTTVYVARGNDAVGQAAVQIALAAGAQYVFARADEKFHTHLKKMGAHPLPTQCETAWTETMRGKIDVAIEAVGETSLETSIALTSGGGRVVCIGEAAEYSQSTSFRITHMFVSNLFDYEILKDMKENTSEFREDLRSLVKLLTEKKISPRVSTVLELPDVTAAEVNYTNMLKT